MAEYMYYQLTPGEIIQAGDEIAIVEDGFDALWIPADERDIGSPAPDSSGNPSRQVRRQIEVGPSECADELHSKLVNAFLEGADRFVKGGVFSTSITEEIIDKDGIDRRAELIDYMFNRLPYEGTTIKYSDLVPLEAETPTCAEDVRRAVAELRLQTAALLEKVGHIKTPEGFYYSDPSTRPDTPELIEYKVNAGPPLNLLALAACEPKLRTEKGDFAGKILRGHRSGQLSVLQQQVLHFLDARQEHFHTENVDSVISFNPKGKDIVTLSLEGDDITIQVTLRIKR